MSNRHDRHQIAVDEVDDAVREALNEDFSLKPVAQTDLTVVVPINIGVELRLGFRVPDDIQCYAR